MQHRIGMTVSPQRLSLIATFTAFCLLTFTSSAAAQNDEQLWLSAEARWDASDLVRLSLGQQVRMDQGMSRVGKIAPELAISFDLPAGFRVYSGYRYTWDRRSEGDWRNEHRLFVGARYSYDIGDFELGYRLEFQEDLYEKRDERLHDNVLRSRMSLAYEGHDVVQPFVSYEKLADIGGTPGTGLRNWRLTTGVDLDFDDHGLEVFYRFRRAFGAGDADHIVGLGYTISF